MIAAPDRNGSSHRRRAVIASLLLLGAPAAWLVLPFVAFGTSTAGSVVLRAGVATALTLAALWVGWPLLRRLRVSRRQTQSVLQALAFIAGLAAIGFLGAAYYDGKLHLAGVEWTLEGIVARDVPSGELDTASYEAAIGRILPVLDSLEDLAQEVGGGGLTRRMFPQTAAVTAAADAAYVRGLVKLLLPLVVNRLETQLRDTYADIFLYQTLRIYLMLDHPEYRDTDAIRWWFDASLRNQLPPDMLKRLHRHVASLLGSRSLHTTLDTQLVEEVRAHLRTVPTSVRLYADIEARLGRELPTWGLEGAVPAVALRHFARLSGRPLAQGVPGLYTRGGYDAFRREVRQALDRQPQDRWVLGDRGATDTEAASMLAQALDARYAREFVRHWSDFIADLTITPTNNVRELAAVVDDLGAADSPLRQVLQAVDAQTSLRPPAGAGHIGLASDPTTERLGRLAVRDGGERPVPAQISETFEPLHRLLDPRGGGPSVVDEAVTLLAALGETLTALAYVADIDSTAFDTVLGHPATKDKMRRVAEFAARVPAPLGGWLSSVSQLDFLRDSVRIGDQVAERMQAAWEADVVPQCRAMLEGRYPFAATSSTDAAAQDVERLFAPGGTFDRYWQAHLEPYVDTSRAPWRAKTQLPLDLSPQLLAFFERVAAVRRMLFAPDAASLGRDIEVRPLQLSSNANRVTLTLGEDRVAYAHGPSRPTLLRWPTADTDAAIVFEPGGGASGAKPTASATGPWALLRLLDQADVQATADGRAVEATFKAGGLNATFQVRFTSESPLAPALLRGLQCPSNVQPARRSATP